MYQADPEALPDDRFAPGELGWLVAGNDGRLLDDRRTPVRVTAIDLRHGFFEIEIAAFEDKGARWLVPLEEVTRYQFSPHGERASASVIAQMTDTIARLNVALEITPDQETGRRSEQKIAAGRARARDWLTAHGAPDSIDPARFIDSRRGSPQAFRWLAHYLADSQPAGLADMDNELATSYVSNPWSGDLIRAHRRHRPATGSASPLTSSRPLSDWPVASNVVPSRAYRSANATPPVSLLHTGERLFSHFHPDAVFAERHLSLPSKKNEAWIVLAAGTGRPVPAWLGPGASSPARTAGAIRAWFA